MRSEIDGLDNLDGLAGFDLSVLSIIKGTYEYKGFALKSIGPFTVLDVQSITSSSFDLVSDSIVKLICYGLIYFQGDHLYCVDGIQLEANS